MLKNCPLQSGKCIQLYQLTGLTLFWNKAFELVKTLENEFSGRSLVDLNQTKKIKRNWRKGGEKPCGIL